MKTMTVPFHRPDITSAEIDAVVTTMKNGWLTMGPVTFAFEKAIADYTGAGHAVAVNSCTAALHLALAVADIGPGDEVIVPATTFVATAEVVRYLGATVVLADIDPETHCIDPADVRKKISPRTKAVIPVHYSGHTADMDAIMAIAEEFRLTVIEDAAHSLPAWYKGRAAGTIGHLGCYSFYATKTVTTGEGGMIVTRNEAWAERLRLLRLHGISRDAWKRYDVSGSWRYDVLETGYKYNLSDIHAAIGLEQVKRSDEMLEKRRSIAARYSAAFGEIDGLIPYREKEWCRSSWHLYPLKFEGTTAQAGLDRIIDLLKERGVVTSVHFIPLHHFTAYRDLAVPLPVAEDLFSRTISLPIFPTMTDEEIDYCIASVIDVAGSLS